MENKRVRFIGNRVVLGVLLLLLVGCAAWDNGGKSSDDDQGGTNQDDKDTGQGGDVTIFDIQQGKVTPGEEVTLKGVVATSPLTYDGEGMFVQDPEGGKWSGIYIFLFDEVSAAIAPEPGDVMNLTGVYEEFFETSEIKVTSPSSIEIVDKVTAPVPVVVSANEVGTAGKEAEAYEGVLVKVENVQVSKNNLGFGEFEIDSALIVDDIFFVAGQAPKPSVGDTFTSITGPLHYSYENFKLEPRSLEDFEGGEIDTGDTDEDTDTGSVDDSNIVTIYQIQNGEVAPETLVTLKDVVVTSPIGFDGQGFFVQEKDGGAQSGIYVYAYKEVLATHNVKPGDVLQLTGEYIEFHDLSEISVKETSMLTITGTAAVPTPALVAAEDIATSGTLGEQYEGVLVQVENVTVTDDSRQYGEWVVNSSLIVDDYFFAKDTGPSPSNGDEFAKIIGPLFFSFDDFKIVPRTMEDLVVK